jgi:tetratricopeptide (TPR) repeat protein
MSRSLPIFFLSILIAFGATTAFAQSDPAEFQAAFSLMTGVTTTMIIVIVLIAILVVAGGLVMFMRLRQLSKLAQEQRTKLAEMQALYRELQGARKRTENALAMMSGKNAELDNTRSEIDSTLKSALAGMTQAVALLPVGENQYRAQDYTGALATYRRAVEMSEENPLALYRAGYASIQVGQLDRAMGHLNQALDVDPTFAPAQAALGYLYRRLAEAQETDDRARNSLFDEAERHLNEALSQNRRLLDEDGEAWLATLAGLQRRRRQYEQALRTYTEATEVTPFAAYPYGAMALVYADKSDYPQMIKQYERVEWRARNEVSARPTNPWGHANLLLARVALGREDKLIEEEFTLMFLSLPRESAFILPTVMGSLRRQEWALASAGHPERAERSALLLQRIQRLEHSSSPQSTQVMRASDVARATDAVRRARLDNKRATQSSAPTAEFSARSDEFDDLGDLDE